MSYTEEVADELAAIAVKRRCCRRAFLIGATRRRDDRNGDVFFSVAHHDAVFPVETAFSGLYRQPVHAVPVKRGSRIRYSFHSAEPAFLADVNAAHGENAESLLVCDGCAAAFLRGLFLSGGTVNDPRSGAFHLAFTVNADDATAETVLNAVGLPPKTIIRPHGKELYFKDSTVISDVLAAAGLHKLLFDFYNAKIEREIRNNENRATNCVAKNIEKSAKASSEQIAYLNALKNSVLFNRLSDENKQTLNLRLDNPEATLDELAAMHLPPLTKSGLYHRLQRLCRMAQTEGGRLL